jgi:superfamily I DNA and RNA helicase
VLQTQLLTGADIGVAVIEGQGPPIEIVDVTDHPNTATVLERRLEDWLDNGIRPGHITILSPMTFSESSASLLPTRLKSQLVRVDAKAALCWPPTSLTFSTIRDFKGLENRCIAVVDLDRFAASANDIAELYVAMTRAHAGLWLGVPHGQRPALNNLIAEHTAQLLKQGVRI